MHVQQSIFCKMTKENNSDSETAESLLLFHVSPVQDFISQARSTRDLWSGSYLISWLTGNFLARLQSSDKGMELFVPKLEGDARKMLDWISDPSSRIDRNGKAATISVIPNQLFARVSNDFDSTKIESIIDSVFSWDWIDPETQKPSVWRQICDRCHEFLRQEEKKLAGLLKKQTNSEFKPLLWDLWEGQLSGFWHPDWLIWPSPGESVDLATLTRLFNELPTGRLRHNDQMDSQPSEWMMRFQVASHRFEARRRTRDFCAWNGVPGLQKDCLSGKEEALTTRDWLLQIPRGAAGKEVVLNHLLRKNDPLGAPNLVKRVWHKAYLEVPVDKGGTGLNKRTLEKRPGSYFDIPSVPGVAAFPWARAIWAGEEDAAFQKFWPAVEKLDDYLDLQLPKLQEWSRETAKDWLARVDWEVFRKEFWEEQGNQARESHEVEWIKTANQGLQAVRSFLCDRRCGSPSSYYAVLAGDGDATGRWLSGLDSNNKSFDLDPDFHGRLSSGVAHFSSQNARLIVEDIEKSGPDGNHFQGKLIYAGGEDVLAIIPAEQAIACAMALRRAYQANMPHRVDARFTYSVGIAIGHIKEPLQDMIEAAGMAERRAKDDLGRNALAVTLFKRSGETIEWGCPFSHGQKEPSAALHLLQFLQSDNRFRSKVDEPSKEPPISGRFPHRLVELLSRYQTYERRDGLPDFSKPEPLSAILFEIAEREVQWIINRQTRKGLGIETDDDLKKLRETLEAKCGVYLKELLDQRRPLSEFYNLFAIEAFIAGQGD